MTATTHERIWSVRRQPNAVHEARRFAELAVTFCGSDCREATVMAVSEFAENLIKYGVQTDGSNAGTIAVSVEGDLVRVRVTNVVASPAEARFAQDMISRIASSPDLTELYRKRLQELFENPGLPRAQLGLLRVAFEGGFRLSCSMRYPLLEIIAERRCKKAP
jgi:anti-sigma regulatory factor (Ser/Thr protein kinase)